MYKSSKVYDGFSCVFRQWRAEGTHCKFLHGYSVYFRIDYVGALDEKNWVWDFGGMKRAKGKIDGMNPREWFDYMLDHTTLVAQDDPELETFKKLDEAGALKLRILPSVGAERFAEFLFNKINPFVLEESNGRVKIKEIEVFEHPKNSATYINEN